MRNEDFYKNLFGDFWKNIDKTRALVDEQSMFGDAAVFEWIIRATKPVEILEVGSWKGHSANFMIDQCKSNNLPSRIVCVDTFLGGPEHWIMPGLLESLNRQNGNPRILDAFIGNVLARGNAGRVFPLTIDSRAGAQVLKHHRFEADLIFIDGAHGYGDVVDDIMNFYPLLSEKGIMFGDDYQYHEVANAVHDCAKKLGVSTVVSSRKWIYVNEALMRALGREDFQLRDTFDGWVHP